MKLNFDNRVAQFDILLNTWKQRNLTIYGRNQIIKSLAMPRLLYVCNLLVPPKLVVLNIKCKTIEFIWNTKRPKLKYETLIKEYKDGGIKLVDFETCLKTQRVMWVKRIVTGEDNTWKIFSNLYFKSFGGTHCIRCNFSCNIVPLNIPKFYQLILEAWAEFVNHTPNNVEQVLVQPLLCNKFIVSNKKSMFNKGLANSGLRFMADIWNTENQTFRNLTHFFQLLLIYISHSF